MPSTRKKNRRVPHAKTRDLSATHGTAKLHRNPLAGNSGAAQTVPRHVQRTPSSFRHSSNGSRTQHTTTRHPTNKSNTCLSFVLLYLRRSSRSSSTHDAFPLCKADKRADKLAEATGARFESENVAAYTVTSDPSHTHTHTVRSVRIFRLRLRSFS